jgi:hypothetical protein
VVFVFTCYTGVEYEDGTPATESQQAKVSLPPARLLRHSARCCAIAGLIICLHQQQISLAHASAHAVPHLAPLTRFCAVQDVVTFLSWAAGGLAYCLRPSWTSASLHASSSGNMHKHRASDSRRFRAALQSPSTMTAS